MSLKIRLSRGGAKKRPFYRIVVADSRSPRDGRYIERVGSYNPMLAKDHPDRVVLKSDRSRHRLDMGARTSERVAQFLGRAEIIPMPAHRNNPKQSQPRPKTVARMEAAEEDKKAKQEAAKVAAAAPPAEEAPPVEEAPPAEEPTAEEPAAEAAPAEEPAAEEAVAEAAPTEAEPAAEAATEAAPPAGDAPAEAPAAEEAAADGKSDEAKGDEAKSD